MLSLVHTRSRVPARRGAIAQATQDFQGKCFIEQFHPDDNVRRKLNTGPRKGDLKKKFVCLCTECLWRERMHDPILVFRWVSSLLGNSRNSKGVGGRKCPGSQRSTGSTTRSTTLNIAAHCGGGVVSRCLLIWITWHHLAAIDLQGCAKLIM